MNQIPAHCPSCGAVFASRMFSFGGNIQNLTLVGNKESCPFCPGMAEVADGVFNIFNNTITMISGPSMTKNMLEALRNLAESAYKEKMTFNEFTASVDEISPELGDSIRSSVKSPKFYMSFLLFLIFVIKSCSININLDVNELYEQVTSSSPSEIASTENPVNKQNSGDSANATSNRTGKKK